MLLHSTDDVPDTDRLRLRAVSEVGHIPRIAILSFRPSEGRAGEPVCAPMSSSVLQIIILITTTNPHLYKSMKIS